MASTATASDATVPAQKAPLSSHPAFTAIVVLWFTALLGVGTLMVPSVLIEQALFALGADSLAPAADAPLGPTARALIAVAFGFAGMALGLVIANTVKKREVTSEPLRVLNAHDDLGDDRFDNAADRLWTPIEITDVAPEAAPAPASEEAAPVELFPRSHAERSGASRRMADQPVTLERRFGPRRTDELAPVQPAPAPVVHKAPDSVPLADLGLVQLVERLGSSLAARRALSGQPAKSVTEPAQFSPIAVRAQEIAASVPADEAVTRGAGDEGEKANEASFGSLIELRRPSLAARRADVDLGPQDFAVPTWLDRSSARR